MIRAYKDYWRIIRAKEDYSRIIRENKDYSRIIEKRRNIIERRLKTQSGNLQQ